MTLHSPIPKHKVFISFHHEDQAYKDRFVKMMNHDFIDKSVKDGDINDNIKTDTIRQKVRDEFIRDASVTVVLIGKRTWQRKHVDWEIGSSISKTKRNPRCGLLGILLPTHWNYNEETYNPRLIPPRLYDNCNGNNSYASLYDWSSDPDKIRRWIHQAFQKRDAIPPVNSRLQYKNNRTNDPSKGWQN